MYEGFPSFIRSFIPSVICLFIHTFIRSFVQPLFHSTRAFNDSVIRSFIHSFVHAFSQSFTNPFSFVMYSCIMSASQFFIQEFIHSFLHSLIPSFTRPGAHAFIYLFVHSVSRSVSQPVSQSFHIIPVPSQKPLAHSLMHAASIFHCFCISTTNTSAIDFLQSPFLVETSPLARPGTFLAYTYSNSPEPHFYFPRGCEHGGRCYEKFAFQQVGPLCPSRT